MPDFIKANFKESPVLSDFHSPNQRTWPAMLSTLPIAY